MTLKLKMESGGDCCVYAIVNHATDKYYVGSTTRRYHRWLDHCRMLEQNRHHAPKLQASYNKYGPDVFEFVILDDECAPEDLPYLEQVWLEEGDCYENGYNTIADVALTAPLLQSARVNKKWSDPLQRKRHSERMKELWRGEKYRAIVLARVPRKTKVLVVCHANEYRSPLAAALLASHPHIEVRQGGVKEGAFNKPCAKKIRNLAEQIFGLMLTDHRSRQATKEDIRWAQYILYMDGGNLEKLPAAPHSRKVYCLANFANNYTTRIPDPAFMKIGSEKLVLTVELIAECVANFAEQLRINYANKRAPLVLTKKEVRA